MYGSYCSINIMSSGGGEQRRLDYLCSQEPGHLSQANAIDVVDKLLVEDDIDISENTSIDQICEMKSASMLGAKVAQCLAKNGEHSSSFKKGGVFDWVDTPNQDNCITGIVSYGKHEVHLKNQVKCLESQRFSQHRTGTKTRDLIECVEEPGSDHLENKSETISAVDDSYEAYDIGPNTQMAAEAMEALFNASAIGNDSRENAHPGNSILIMDSIKEVEMENASSVHPPVQKTICLPHSFGGTMTESEQSKVISTRLNEEGSCSWRKRPSKSTARKTSKQMAGKSKKNVEDKKLSRNINHEEPKGITRAVNLKLPHLLGEDAVIHPKRKRTYMFTSGQSKIDFNEAIRPISVGAKCTEDLQLSTEKGVSISSKNMLPDTIDGMKRNHKLSLNDQKIMFGSSTDASDRTSAVAIKGRVCPEEFSCYNQVTGSLSRIGQEKQFMPEENVQGSSLTRRVPLRKVYYTLPQSKMQTSKNSLKNGFSKSPRSRELASLVRNEPSSGLQSYGRRRRYMSTIRVLFSQSMDQETIKQQRKILTYFGVPAATAISEATHFVANKFARTRNMLEAIARGIPVVTPSWLECCGEARYLIEEKKYILRDLKKEKEVGFSMPVSLSQACQNPLLEGIRVFITPNAKPGKAILKSLVVAAHGQPLERITVSMTKTKNLKGAFVISCEEDYSICLPLVRIGLEVFDSELLLNGIIIQKLEFERCVHAFFSFLWTRELFWPPFYPTGRALHVLINLIFENHSE